MSRSHTLTLAHELRGRQRAHRYCRQSTLWLPLTAALVVSMLSSVVGADAYTPAEQAEIEALKDDVTRFEDAAGAYRATVDRLVKGAYEDRRKQVLEQYSDKIIKGEEQERTRRIAAITLFEDFLQRYPNDRRWTPDVIFRLAELYFEKSHDEYLLAPGALREAAAAGRRAEAGRACPHRPEQDYSRTIALHRRLIREWPDYRLIDGAYYLLGFCLSEMGETRDGQPGDVCRWSAPTRYRPPLEQQTQVAPNELDVKRAAGLRRFAIAQRCTADQQQPVQQLQALARKGTVQCRGLDARRRAPLRRKRAGTGHRRLPACAGPGAQRQPVLRRGAVQAGLDLLPRRQVHRVDRTFRRAGGLRGQGVGAHRQGRLGDAARGDPIPRHQLLRGGLGRRSAARRRRGLPRLEKFYDGRHEEKHVFEVYRRLGDIYFDTTKYDQAIEVYKLILKRWPYNPEDPDVQDKIIVAMERQREFEQAIQEREEFSRLFGKGTEWERRNRNNPEALKKARDYDEQALIQAAVHHHKAGQDLRKRGIALKDVELLKRPARNTPWPPRPTSVSRAIPQLEEFLRDSLLLRQLPVFLAAVSRGGQGLRGGARLQSGQPLPGGCGVFGDQGLRGAHQAADRRRQAVRSRSCPPPRAPPTSRWDLPEEFKQWQESLDMYAKLLPRAPRRRGLPTRRRRSPIGSSISRMRASASWCSTTSYCADAMSINAGQAILVTYQLEKNLDAMQDWATKLSSGKCGGSAAGGKVRAGAKQLLVGIKFKRAETAFQQAEKLYALARSRRPRRSTTRPLAPTWRWWSPTRKAATPTRRCSTRRVAYEKSMRYESATKIYERVWQKYPKSPLADEALWRSAENYKRFFEFKKAVNNYLIMADAPRFAESQPSRGRDLQCRR